MTESTYLSTPAVGDRWPQQPAQAIRCWLGVSKHFLKMFGQHSYVRQMPFPLYLLTTENVCRKRVYGLFAPLYGRSPIAVRPPSPPRLRRGHVPRAGGLTSDGATLESHRRPPFPPSLKKEKKTPRLVSSRLVYDTSSDCAAHCAHFTITNRECVEIERIPPRSLSIFRTKEEREGRRDCGGCGGGGGGGDDDDDEQPKYG
ncbi:hypothetical protein V9T40_010526 [Parthenolecanium corni]|uniref:Uncharacterized protein n=1 Tax=Parthenolecanium corni TaxID=536013 RepID=A0AAN9T6B0_9HEMI